MVGWHIHPPRSRNSVQPTRPPYRRTCRGSFLESGAPLLQLGQMLSAQESSQHGIFLKVSGPIILIKFNTNTCKLSAPYWPPILIHLEMGSANLISSPKGWCQLCQGDIGIVPCQILGRGHLATIAINPAMLPAWGWEGRARNMENIAFYLMTLSYYH